MVSNDFFHSPGKMWLVGLLIVAIVSGGVAYQPKLLKGLKGQVLVANPCGSAPASSAYLIASNPDLNFFQNPTLTVNVVPGCTIYSVSFNSSPIDAAPYTRITLNGKIVTVTVQVDPSFLSGKNTVSFSTQGDLADTVVVVVTDKNGTEHTVTFSKNPTSSGDAGAGTSVLRYDTPKNAVVNKEFIVSLKFLADTVQLLRFFPRTGKNAEDWGHPLNYPEEYEITNATVDGVPAVVKYSTSPDFGSRAELTPPPNNSAKTLTIVMKVKKEGTLWIGQGTGVGTNSSYETDADPIPITVANEVNGGGSGTATGTGTGTGGTTSGEQNNTVTKEDLEKEVKKILEDTNKDKKEGEKLKLHGAAVLEDGTIIIVLQPNTIPAGEKVDEAGTIKYAPGVFLVYIGKKGDVRKAEDRVAFGKGFRGSQTEISVGALVDNKLYFLEIYLDPTRGTPNRISGEKENQQLKIKISIPESSTGSSGAGAGAGGAGPNQNSDLPTRQIFVTSDTSTPNQFRGYPFMDALCDKVANDAGVKHSPGAQGWLALVSSKVEPKRVAADLLKDGVMYTRVPRTAPAQTPKDARDPEEMGRVDIGKKADILSGKASKSVLATEKGKSPGETGLPFYYFKDLKGLANNGQAWTGSSPDGQPNGRDCGGWSSDQGAGTYGNADGIPDLVGKDHNDCTNKQPLYCVEQDGVTPAAVNSPITQVLVANQPTTVTPPTGGTIIGMTITPTNAPAAGEKPGIYYTEYKKQPTGETVPSNSRFVSGFDVSLPGVDIKEGCMTIKVYEKDFPGTIERNFAIRHTRKDGTQEWLNWADKGIVTDAGGVYHNIEVCSSSFSPFSIYSVPDTKNPDSNTPAVTQPATTIQPTTNNQQPVTAQPAGGVSYGAIGNNSPASSAASSDSSTATAPSSATTPSTTKSSASNVTQEKAVLNENKLKESTTVQEKIAFSDVGSKSPYKAAIQKVAEKGIMTGSRDPLKPSQKLFKENNALNRAELTSIIIRWLFPNHGSPSKTQACIFKDVDLTAWFGDFVFKACEEKLVKGYTDQSFRPESSVNVVEALKIIVEAGARFAPQTIGASLKQKLNAQKSTDQWYSAYLRTAEKSGLLSSAQVGAVKKNPSAAASRGWVAQMIANIL